MRQEFRSDFTKEPENENPSLERQSSMELAEYVFMPDQEMWHGYLKGYPNFEAYGESFEELQLKLHQLHPDLSRLNFFFSLLQCGIALLGLATAISGIP